MTTTAQIVAVRSAPTEGAPTTVAGFLREHPWPADLLALGRPLEFLWHFDLDVRPEDLWPYVMDTSHFNRALGMGRMDFREVDGVLHGATRNAGVLQEWVEVPWTWVAERSLESARRYSRGFARYVRAIYVLEPRNEGRVTRLHVYFGWIPRGYFMRLFLGATFPMFRRGYQRVLDEIAAHIRDARAAASPYERPAPALAPEARSRLEAARVLLEKRLRERGAPAGAVDPLVDYLANADEMDLYRIQVLPLARRWGVDPTELLVTCLHATRVGLLTLSWDVICPHCRGVRQEARTLGDVPSRGECEVCEIDFDTSTENSIEITFHLHPSIRDVPKMHFCAAEPATKQHILVQQRLAPGARARLATTLGPGRYRLRVGGEKQGRMLDVVPGAGAPRELAWSPSDGAGADLRADAAPVLELHNTADAERSFVVEDARWSDNALRPVQLFTLQEFRDLFSEEFLTADVQLSIGEQTILFTDMIGSTRFYDHRGDPEAFAEVKRHFREVYEVVKTHRGAVVKTIGDAVMAAFHEPLDALRAAEEIHRRFPEGRPDTSIRLRISLNRGPCIAVNLNSAIDYFGRTVNLASKLQACVEAGQVSFPRTLREAPGVADFLASRGATLEEVTVSSASLSEPILAFRWDVNGAASASAPGAGRASLLGV